MLSDIEIEKLARYLTLVGRPLICPFQRKKLGPVSYDLTTKVLGEYNGWVRLVSEETVWMPRDHYGLVAPRSRVALKCMDCCFGTLVDPGFMGNLVFYVKPFGEDKEYNNLFQLLIGKVDGDVGVAYNERSKSSAMGRKGF